MLLSRPASTALLAVLRGEDAPAPPSAELLARAADGDEDARRALAEGRQRELGGRLASWGLARERVEVVLDDGSALSLEDAERLLARREERQLHRPLRRAVDRALAPVRQFNDGRSEELLPDLTLDALLAGTADLARAALEVLQDLGGASPRDEHELARLLDLPDGVFHLDVALAVVAVTRAAAGVPLRSARVPRALVGVVLVDEEARFGVHAGTMRADRFARTVKGGVTALALQARASTTVAAGVALGALTPATLRAAGLGREEAERVARMNAARAVLQVRTGAALARSGWPDALERALPVSVRPSDCLRELLDLDGGASTTAAFRDQLGAASMALRLRDAFDDAFAIRAATWHEPIAPVEGDLSSAWLAWAGPWL